MSRAAISCIVGCLVALAADAARASVVLELRELSLLPELSQSNPPVAYDVWAHGSGTENEQLFAYDLGFTLQRVEGPGTAELTPPYAQKPDAGFVFANQPTDFGVAPGATSSSVVISVVNNGTLVDLTEAPVKLATLVLNADRSHGDFVYRLVVDLDRTDFASGDPTRADPTLAWDVNGPFDNHFGTIEYFVPEPTGLAPLALAGMACLRRRRR